MSFLYPPILVYVERTVRYSPLIPRSPEILSKQLEKAGFKYKDKVFMPFGDEIVEKNVMINNATREEDLQYLFTER